ncbi:MAG TPA: hypothetical protein VJ205_04590, partial [Gammaproteobacteria bacterium]|nr:hypothetical protein [Gammaproteobacteria bacterium]
LSEIQNLAAQKKKSVQQPENHSVQQPEKKGETMPYQPPCDAQSGENSQNTREWDHGRGRGQGRGIFRKLPLPVVLTSLGVPLKMGQPYLPQIAQYVGPSVAKLLSGGFSWASGLVLGGVVFVGTIALQFVRDLFQKQQYQAYKAKNAQELAELQPDQVKAFELGVKAGESYMGYFQSFGERAAWKHLKAFAAGQEAKECKDEDTINRVKSSIKPS